MICDLIQLGGHVGDSPLVMLVKFKNFPSVNIELRENVEFF